MQRAIRKKDKWLLLIYKEGKVFEIRQQFIYIKPKKNKLPTILNFTNIFLYKNIKIILSTYA